MADIISTMIAPLFKGADAALLEKEAARVTRNAQSFADGKEPLEVLQSNIKRGNDGYYKIYVTTPGEPNDAAMTITAQQLANGDIAVSSVKNFHGTAIFESHERPVLPAKALDNNFALNALSLVAAERVDDMNAVIERQQIAAREQSQAQTQFIAAYKGMLQNPAEASASYKNAVENLLKANQIERDEKGHFTAEEQARFSKIAGLALSGLGTVDQAKAFFKQAQEPLAIAPAGPTLENAQKNFAEAYAAVQKPGANDAARYDYHQAVGKLLEAKGINGSDGYNAQEQAAFKEAIDTALSANKIEGSFDKAKQLWQTIRSDSAIALAEGKGDAKTAAMLDSNFDKKVDQSDVAGSFDDRRFALQSDTKANILAKAVEAVKGAKYQMDEASEAVSVAPKEVEKKRPPRNIDLNTVA